MAHVSMADAFRNSLYVPAVLLPTMAFYQQTFILRFNKKFLANRTKANLLPIGAYPLKTFCSIRGHTRSMSSVCTFTMLSNNINNGMNNDIHGHKLNRIIRLQFNDFILDKKIAQ